MNKFRFIVFLLLLFFCGFTCAQNNLSLDKVTIVSRHGVRAPLEEYINTLNEITGGKYHWTKWSVPGSYLTLRGGALETLFGEYFRLWLDDEDFKLNSSDIYFGASSKQRTIATARAFAAGMLPLMTVPIDYKVKADGSIGYLDQDYLPLLNDRCAADGFFDTVAFKTEAYRELGELQAPSYEYLEKILRMKHSNYAKNNENGHFDNTVGVNLYFYKGDEKQEPKMLGGLNDANMASDAFILQYYEMGNARTAAFGRRLSFDDWKKLAYIKDCYGEVLFTKAPIISVNISHCMLQRIQTEMAPEGHKFAFLCTHDSMIAAVLAALRVDDYELPNTIEVKTPIGFKLVLEQWVEKTVDNPQKYVRARLVYQSTEQIRGMEPMDLSNPPMSYELSLMGLEKAPNGMYRYDDFMNHLQKSIDAYNATAKGQHPWN
ncbi:MAG: histidine-type phosphatase [Bacteroidales bacterium]|nr:histidine-type phosphatase [Bacteroidales bacterium]